MAAASLRDCADLKYPGADLQVPGERYPRVDTLGYFFSFHLIRPVCALGTFPSRREKPQKRTI